MRRIPVLPTLLVALAVAGMIALGVWQLKRMQWKNALLARMEAARALPVVGEDALFRPNLNFRRAEVSCAASGEKPLVRAGRSLSGQTGYDYLIPCRFHGGEVLLVAGWSERPTRVTTITVRGAFRGVLTGTAPMGQLGALPYTLHATRAVAPLAPSAAPSTDAIPNNHFAYAIQWFAFAAVAVAIYVIALLRRRSTIAPGRDAL